MALKDSYSGSMSNADLLQPTSFNSDVFSDSNELRTKVWSELVTRDAREKNVFKKFIGSEGSSSPIIEKRDISAGGSDQVVFTTVAPIRGQGVRGEEILKNSTGKLNFGTFKVQVDLIRHAVSWTQVLKLMRFTGKTLDQLSAEVMSEWASRMEQDLIQQVLRDTCLNKGGQNVLNGYGADSTGLVYGEGLSTDIIQEAKQNLISNGGQPMNTGGDQNQDIPGYLFFAPDACLRPLRSDPDYLEAILQADSRSGDNKLYSGSYAKWDNNIIANHNIIIDTAQGRQGSPLAPVAQMPAGIGAATSVNGWDKASGALNSYTVAANNVYGAAGTDLWANWPGSAISIPGGGGKQHANETVSDHFVLIVDSAGNYCGQAIADIGSDNDGSGTGSAYLKVGTDIADAKLAGQNRTMTGPLTFYLANLCGTPIGYTLALGKGALYLARGAVSNEQIFHYDDFANSGNQAHLSAVGVQSVYGLAAYEDTNDRVPGACLIETVRQVPGLSLGAQDPDGT